MHRRALLTGSAAALVAGAAGCLGEIGSTSSARAKNTERELALVEQESIPDEYGFSIDVTLLEETVTEDQSARLEVRTTNEGDERALSVGEAGCSLFNRSRGGSDDPEGLWLYRHIDHLERVDGRWVEDRDADEGRTFTTQGCPPRAYDPGESIVTEYEVWHDFQVEGYFEPGTYHWSQRVSGWDDPDARWDADKAVSLEWGFALRVSNPDS
ncbi:hypothetical protein [Natronosalvus caseinilyticus]|uniref:hypothetical protein n=1 Tax=Natronosalvus caseinilyticus TaxID=2953747 RepID=UPI0028A80519|nr:hypothetical protein [Natronosalvus caseinilyticus]